MNAIHSHGLVYDAAAVSRVLGIPCECNDPVPKARGGEIVIYYGGWDLPTLRNCIAGKNYMWLGQGLGEDQNWYDKKGWKAEPGYYLLNLRLPGSDGETYADRCSCLRTMDKSLQPAAVPLAVTALLVHLTETGKDLLEGDRCRCQSLLPDGETQAVLMVSRGRVYVSSGWAASSHTPCLAVCRTS